MQFVFSSEGAAKWQAGAGKTISFATANVNSQMH